uniref:Uncharacterized protein n=1 Tax=Trypanosoma vivax (strain Y486) TaxID=1055687 RepID=G0TSL2_TRYVY|nr:hypothetical protein TVY486_0301290 [Trypanosoma vivax Y486]
MPAPPCVHGVPGLMPFHFKFLSCPFVFLFFVCFFFTVSTLFNSVVITHRFLTPGSFPSSVWAIASLINKGGWCLNQQTHFIIRTDRRFVADHLLEAVEKVVASFPYTVASHTCFYFLLLQAALLPCCPLSPQGGGKELTIAAVVQQRLCRRLLSWC